MILPAVPGVGRSAFGRAEYAYKSRYLVSGVLRRDGSSKFGPNARWGIFPAISGAWVISDEPAYRWAQTIDFAKLRASFGVAGNDQIPNFAYRALLNGEGVYPFNDLTTKTPPYTKLLSSNEAL